MKVVIIMQGPNEVDSCNRLGLILPLHQSGENKDKIFSIMFVVSYF